MSLPPQFITSSETNAGKEEISGLYKPNYRVFNGAENLTYHHE
jgi:hypothetical protein